MAVRPLDESSVEKKLRSLSNTQESIQSLSLWIIHHKAHHERIVELWFKAMKKADYSKRLTLLYLCNDIVQTCKRKHAVMYKDAFKEVLRDVALLISDGSVRNKVERIFGIWLERNIYDQTFTDELVAILNNTHVKTTVNSKLLSEFKPEVLIEKVNKFKQLTTDVELKRRQLVVLSLDASRVDAVQQLKDRAHGREFSRQFEESCQKLDDYVHHLEVEIKDRADLTEMLEESEIYYDAQYGEAKIVTNAYKNFGTRVNNLRKKLIEYAKTVPDPVTASPILSPSMDAPSPGNTPSEDEMDNRETVDMDLSDEEAGAATAHGTASKKQSAARVTSPTLQDNTDSPTPSPSHADDDELDLFKLLPTLSKGARSSFLTSSSSSLDLQPSLVKPHLDPRQSNAKSSHPNVVWNATHGFTTNPEDSGAAPLADEVPKVKESNLLQLTDGDGDSTPVKDEGRSTPVMDEKPEGSSIANPIEFLTQLISQGRKEADGTPSSFMQSLSVLTSSVSAQFQPSSDSNDSPSADASMSPPGVTPPSSWAAWKAKQDPAAPAENGTQQKTPSAIPQPIPPPVAPPVNFSRPIVPRFPQAPVRPSAPPSYSPSRGPFDPVMQPMSSPLPVPPPPRMPIFAPQQPRPVTQSPARAMWHPVPPMFPPGSLQPPRDPTGVVSPSPPVPTQLMRDSLPRLMLHTAPGGSVPANFNPFPTPDAQTSVGVSIPTVGGSQPQRPQFPPPPQQPTSPFGAPAPIAPVHVTSPTAVEDEQNEFIRKLKRKSGISTIPITPPTPPVGILKSSANSNLRTLTQVQPEEASAMREEDLSGSSMGGDEMELGSSIQTIQSVHMSPNSKPSHMTGPQDFEYKPDEFRPPNTYNSGNRHYNQYQRPHDGHRREGYRRGFQEDAFQRDSYGRLPPKRPPPKFEQGGYYQRY